jgi:hypothetical protein
VPGEWTRLNLFHEAHPDDLPGLRAAFAEMLRTPGAAFTRTVRVRGGAGEWRRLEVTARNLLHDPAVGGIVYNSRDVTAR